MFNCVSLLSNHKHGECLHLSDGQSVGLFIMAIALGVFVKSSYVNHLRINSSL